MYKINTQNDIKEFILQLEKKWKVDEWVVNGIHIWPYVRIKIFTFFLSNIHANSSDDLSIKRKKIFNKLKKASKLLGIFFRLQFFFLSLKRKQILFFGSHIHRILLDGKYFNRFYDSMVEHYNLHNEVYMLEYGKVLESIYNKKAIIDLNKHIEDYKIYEKIMKRFKRVKGKIKLEGYNEFYDVLNSLELDLISLKISKNNIISWTNKINVLEGFFYKLYKKTQPSKIIFLGYYGWDNLTAAILTANKLGIKAIDFQHGTQINNMAFSNWSKIPKEGFNTIVKEFWNWDMESKTNIDLWAENTSVIESKVVGQPFVSYWLKRKNNRLMNGDKKISYSLNLDNIEDILNLNIINLIKELNYIWILRLHPRNKLNISDINDFLLNHKIFDKVIIQNSIEVALPEVFSCSLLHVTDYSGCLIEARMMGLPTVVINRLGSEIYKQYIDDSLVFYLDKESNEFINKFNCLVEKLKKNNANINNESIFNPLE